MNGLSPQQLTQVYAPLPSAAWLRPLRFAWFLLVLLIGSLLLMELPDYYRYLAGFYSAAFADIGLNAQRYALYLLLLDTAVILLHMLLAGLIVWRRPAEGMALLTAVALTANGAVIPFSVFSRSLAVDSVGLALIRLVIYLGLVTSVWMLYLSPDGRFVPRWTKITAVFWAFLILPPLFLPGSVLDFGRWPGALQLIVLILWCGIGAWAQLNRYEHVSGPVQRQQAKWAALGLLVATTAPFTYYFLLFVAPIFAVPDVPNLFQQRVGTSLFTALVNVRFAAITFVRLLALLFPFSFAIAILRYRLWDIDLLINRTLVYSTLTGLVIGLYMFVVGIFGVLLPVQNNLFLSVLATGLIAALFQPLRVRLQRRVNRFMYGEPQDPVTTLAQLGQRLEAAAVPQQTLNTLVATIPEALNVPYAALHLTELDINWQHGAVSEAVIRLPVHYQNEAVGMLLVAHRVSGERFTPAEEILLQNLTHQAGTAVHVLKLTTDLQQVNAQLRQAQQAERQRLRRDLHDGLGPALAGLTLKVEATRNYAERNPEAAAKLLREYKTQTADIIRDIRRIVNDLQPAALDQLGLLSALGEFVSRNSNGRTQLLFEAPQTLPPLPAAVEVVVYRIATEAITNCLRHADATQCTLSLVSAVELLLTIRDNGVGLPVDYQDGIGLSSMRQRVLELGGTLQIETAVGKGTNIFVAIPLQLPDG